MIFGNHTLKTSKIPFKNVVLPGRVKCGGPERKIVVAHGCRKRKKLICGTEEEIMVAHGCLPSPTRSFLVFKTYSGFETITRIHNLQAFTHLRNKTRFFDKGKLKQNRKQKILFFFSLKILIVYYQGLRRRA